LVPTLVLNHKLPEGEKLAAIPYRPLELQGRDIYVREGCYNCHSQMIRPLLPESQRYGEPSTIAESFYDHPFQWGSKRTGPDLARVGGKYPNLWHLEHLKDPRAISPGSNMPPYAWMVEQQLAVHTTAVKLNAMRSLGVPYSSDQVAKGAEDLEVQAKEISADLLKGGANVPWNSEVIALIAYLQRLGRPPAAQSSAGPISLAAPQVP
jgi:cytochrome c oxidase cbb3-type subunit I/II